VCPTVDIFASDINHVADRFVSRFTPGSYQVDALKHDWSTITVELDVIWVFPPHRQVSLALSLLEASKREALVCMPLKAGSNEIIQLHHMQGACISEPYWIPRLVGSCTPSARVSSGLLNPALLQLGVVHVTWMVN
jgi:hypothetical protein